MSTSNNPIANSNPLAPGLGEDELPTGGLLEQTTLDGSLLARNGSSSPIGNGSQGGVIDELSPLEVTPLSPEEPDTLFRGQATSSVSPPSSRLAPQQFQQAEATVFDALTGTPVDETSLGASENPAPIEFTSSVSLSDLIAPSEVFTILAEGRVVVAQGGDFDGDPANPIDDARIYAGNGFNFRQTPILPVQLDAEGNPVLDNVGNPVLIDNAVSVAANYTVARARDNAYSNLTPPEVVAEQTVEVPDFEQIKAVELGVRLSETDTIIEYRPRRRDLDTAAEWQENFPPSGTADSPTIVRLAQGNLRIPDGVNLRNIVILAETGGIRFEGENHKLDNVVLVAEQKAINLGKAHLTNSSVFAKRTIRMDSQARFSGRNVLANGDAQYGLRLDGSTATTTVNDELTVIAQGRLVYNSMTETRARLVAGQTVRFRTSSLLVGSVQSKGDIRFTQDITVVAAPSGPVPDTVAPVLTAGLSNDTGRDNADGITSDPSVNGQVTDDREVGGLVARFASGLNTEFVDVSSSLQADGSFSFSITQLELIYGGALPDGALTLQLLAQDGAGNLSQPVQLSFELDRVAPDANTPELVDGAIGGDGYGITNGEPVRFSIDAEIGSQIQLFLYGQLVAEGVATEATTILAAEQLEEGYLDIDATVTDAAGNTAISDYYSFIVDREASEITLESLVDGSEIVEGSRLKGRVIENGYIGRLRYQFEGMPARDIPVSDNGSFDVPLDSAGLIDGPQTLTVTAVDEAGNETAIALQVTIAVIGDIEPPVVNAQLQTDTGVSDSDGLTNQVGISGTVSDESDVTALRVWFVDTPASEFVDVSDSLNPDGTFVLSAERLGQLYGGELPDGSHTVKIVAVDSEGNVTAPVEVSFVLDTSGPVVNLLAPIADADLSATGRAIGSVDETAISTQISVNGGESRELVLDGERVFDTLLQATPLSEGVNQVTVTATDAAGNQSETIVEFRVAPDFIVGPNGGDGWAMGTAHAIQLSERDSFVVQASRAVDIPLSVGSRTLRFDLEANFDTSDVGTIEDQLLIYLVDPVTGETLLGNGGAGTAVLSLVGETADFTAGLVRFNGTAVEMDLTGLTGVDRAQLVVQLVNADGDTGSTVLLSNLMVDIDPNGVASQVVESLYPTLEVAGELNVNDLTVASPDDVQVQVRNIRLDAETGHYTAQVRVRNRGEDTLGRQVAVVFNDLPAGVQLLDASGIDAEGNPYINLQDAIRAGGLETGRYSDFVTVSFENADLLRFGINPTVLTGGGNQSPVFEVIPPLDVMPGDRVELPLVATDGDGEVVTFYIEPNGPLPKGSLSGDRLIFQPQLDEIGTYTFTVIATDGSTDVRQEVTLNVVPDPVTTTRISGTIASTLTDPNTGEELNLGNVKVMLGDVETITEADGSFTLELSSSFTGSEWLKVYGDSIDGNYPVIAEVLTSALGQEAISGVNNVLARPIYLSPIDPSTGQSIDPTAETVITTDNLPGAVLTVEAGSPKSLDEGGQLSTYTGIVSITQVPADRLPASLPSTLSPDVVVLVQPGGMVFETPASLVLPNSADYASGTEMELYAINSATGEFDVVGTGMVSDDGSVIETTGGGVDHSGWYFFAPMPAGSAIAQEEIDFNLEIGRRRHQTPVASTSAVDLHAGALTEQHQLVSYYSQGVNRSLQLSYDSSRANPTASVAFGRKHVGANGADDYLTAQLKLDLDGFEYSLPNQAIGGSASSQHVWRLPETGNGQTVGGAIRANLRNFSTGAYRYSVESGIQRKVGDGFVGSVERTNGELIVINSIDSLLGAGWGIAGTQEIVATSEGAVLLIDGDGTELLFTNPISNATGGVSFTSPLGDYSTLERLSDGTFRRISKDQTIYDFNATHQLISVSDRNGNIHRHNYDSQGRLVSIVDPVGLETQLSYGNDGRVKAIVDPVGRSTQLKHDSDGNLIQIVDPDGSSRSFEYDRQRNLTAEIDKRGFRQEVEYNSDGQIIAKHRQDGSTSRYQSAQSAIATSNYSGDPASAAVASIFGNANGPGAQPFSAYTDSLGNVTQIGLNESGNPTSVVNGVGQESATFSYDNSNNVSAVKKAGYTTNYTYDERGNVIEAKQLYSSQGGVVDTTTFAYESQFNQLIAIETSSGQKLAYEIDSKNGDVLSSRIIVGQDDRTSSESDDVVTRFVYTDSGLVDYSVDALGRTTDYDYDSYGRLISETAADGSADRGTVRYEYDDFSGNVTARIDENGNRTEYQYDAMNRLLVTSGDDPDGAGPQAAAASRFGYDAAGNLTTAIDGNGNRTRYEYDERNRQSAIIDAAGEQATFFYDSEGNLTVARDFRGKATRYQYDALHRTTSIRDAAGGRTRFTYDERGNVTRETDARGNTTTYEYDSRGRVVLSIDAAGDSTSFGYDNAGNLTSIVDANGNRTRYLYDDLNRQIASIDPYGNRVNSEYDKLGKLIAQTDRRGNTTTFEYDDRDRLVRTTYADRSFTTYAYDKVGNLVGQTDELGRTTSFTYNSLNQLVATKDALGGRLAYVYDGAGNLVSTQDWRNHTTSFEYDNLNRLVRQVDALAGETMFSYDAGGNLLVQTDALGNSTTFSYDALSRLKRVTNQEGGSTVYQYDAVGNVISTKDALGRNDTAKYDAVNRLTRSTNALGKSVNYKYDAVGNLISTTDELGRTTSSEYDKLSRLIATFNADGQAIRFGYDETGNIASITDELGRTSTSGYDSRNRLVESTNPVGDSVVYTYDAVGNLLSTEDELGRVTTNAYDKLNRLVGTTNADGNDVRFTYDASGNLLTVQDELGRVTSNVYDPLNRLTKTINAAGDSVQFTYDAVGNLLAEKDELGRVTAYTYDSLYRLIETQNTLGGTVKYGYDAASNLLSYQDELGRVTSNVYDDLNRLTQTTNAAGDSARYIYDAVGNLLSSEDELGRVTRYAYDNLNQLSETTNALDGTVSYVYDAVGNMVAVTNERGHTSSLKYDELNRVVESTNALGNSDKFTYDSMGNLIATEDALGRVTSNQYDDLNRLVKITNAAGNSSSFEYDASGNLVKTTDELGRENSFEYDALNRQVVSTNAANDSVRYTYDAVGNLVSYEDEISRVSYRRYDELNRLIETIDAAGQSTNFVYDIVGNLVEVSNRLGDKTSNQFDELNRLTQTTNPLGHSINYRYDSVGNQISVSDELGRTTTTVFDELNRTIEVKNPGGGSTFYSYDAVGNLISIQDALGRVTQNRYNEENQVIETEDALGGVTRFSYDPVENIISVTNQLNNTTNYEYDSLNRQVKVTQPLGLTTVIGYDSVGNLTEYIDIYGDRTGYEYDNLDRRTSVTNDSGTTAYTYTESGKIESILDPNNRLNTYTYDSLDNLIQEKNNWGESRYYSYDAEQNLIQKTDRNSNSVAYEYDSTGNLTREVYYDAVVSYQYDAAGQLSRISDNSSSYSYTYDENGNTIIISNSGTEEGARVVQNFSYDSVGNNTKLTTRINGFLSKTKRLSYDELNRISGFQETGSNLLQKDGSFQYDAAGNLSRISTSVFSESSLSITRTYDASGRPIRQTKVLDLGYGPTTYVSNYDPREEHDRQKPKLVEVDDGIYDSKGRLIQDRERIYEYDSEDNLVRTIWKEDGETFVYRRDARYRVREVVDGETESRWQPWWDGEGYGSDLPVYHYDVFNRLIGSDSFDLWADIKTTRKLSYVYEGDNVSAILNEIRSEEDWGWNPPNQDIESHFTYLDGIEIKIADEYFRDFEDQSIESTYDFTFSHAIPISHNRAINDKSDLLDFSANDVLLGILPENLRHPSIASPVVAKSKNEFSVKFAVDKKQFEFETYSSTEIPEDLPQNSPVILDILGVIFSEAVDASQEATRGAIDHWIARANDPNANRLQQAYYTANGSFASILGRVVGLDIDFTGADAVAYYADRFNDPNASFLEKSLYSVSGTLASLGTNRNVVSEAAEDYVEYSAAQFIASDTNFIQKAFYGYTGTLASTLVPENIVTTVSLALGPLAGTKTLLGRTALAADRVVNASDVVAGAGGILNGQYTAGNFLSLLGLRELRGVDDLGRATRNLDRLDDVARTVDDVDNTVARAVSDSTPRRLNDASGAIADNTRPGRATSQAGAFDSVGRGPNNGINAQPIIAPSRRNTGTTVIGNAPAFVEVADSIGARRMGIPAEISNSMSRDEILEASLKFLERTIRRGDEILLATSLSQVRPGSIFADELKFLSDQGFTLSIDGLRLIPPGE